METSKSRNTSHHEGYDKIVTLDKEYAYIEPKTDLAGQKLKREVNLLKTINKSVDVETPRYLYQNNEGQYFFKRIKGHAFSQDIQDTLTEDQIDTNTSILSRFIYQLHSLSLGEGMVLYQENDFDIDLKSNLHHPEVQKYLNNNNCLAGLLDAISIYDSIQVSKTDTGLLHGDLMGYNILLDSKERIVGILDFSDCMIGDIHYDFKFFPGFGASFFESLVRKYEEQSHRPLNRDRLKLYYYLSAFCHLFYSITNNYDSHFKEREGWVQAVLKYHSGFSLDRCIA